MPENIQPYLEEVTKTLQAKGWSETSITQNEDGDVVYKGNPAGYFYNDFSAMEGNEPVQEWIGEFESYVEDNMERIERAIDKNLFDWEVFPDSWKTPERVLGFTDDIMLAGYILSDGSLLDFSGGSRERVVDHREIVHLREGGPGTAGMQEYMAEGNIRIDANTGFIDISKLPTDAQTKRIFEMVKRRQGNLRLGLSYGLGERSDRDDYYLEPNHHRVVDFDVAYPSDIFRAIDEFFEGPKKMPGRRTRKKKASKEKDLGHGSFQDDLVDFRTGEPVDFPYVRMVQDTPFMGETFQQHIDPAGRYMSYNETGEETPLESDRIKATYGEASFSNPLVLWFNTGEEFGYNEHSWKARLHDHYGKAGKALSKAIIKDGYDGIITIRRDTDPPTVSEIVDLRPIVRKTKAWLSRTCKFAQPQQMLLQFHDPEEYTTEPVEVKPDIYDYAPEGAEEDEWATGFYHVTTNLPGVLSSGELKSRSQLEEPVGLGGGGDDVAPNKVSVTHNYDQAFKLRDMMRFAADVVHGKVKPSSVLWEVMQNYGIDDLSLIDNLLRFLAGEGVPEDVVEDEGVNEWLDANIKPGKESYEFMQGVDEAMLRETSGWDADSGQFTGLTMPFDLFSKIKPENIGIVQVMVHKTAKPEHVHGELELRFDPKDVMLMQEESAVIGSRAKSWVLKIMTASL